ncbi:hypothetical protein [Hydrogenophaga sp.]|uniref:hypothetical protein n=1 Tax=Hydrogenophaga sp. TaxID=1904254 RepID=UPI003F6C5C2D
MLLCKKWEELTGLGHQRGRCGTPVGRCVARYGAQITMFEDYVTLTLKMISNNNLFQPAWPV